METRWQDAHKRATAWYMLGQPERILDDAEIPEDLRDRMWSFVNGDKATPPSTLPGESGDWFEDKVEDSNWYRYADLLDRKGWPDRVKQNIDISTHRTMNFLFNPNDENAEKKYGLIVGHVQSGKTADYTGLIARAADSGYNVIIVLAGLHNNLRRQTQIRLEREVMGKSKHPRGEHVKPPDNYDWFKITTQDDDFQTMSDSGFLSGNNPVIGIVKKNKSPLTKLYEMFGSFPEEKRAKLNFLLIDDEADHATINTKKRDGDTAVCELCGAQVEDNDEDCQSCGMPFDDDEEDDEILDATVINTRLRQILGLFPRSAYVGYTATPFANVLISEADDHPTLGKTLYPRDFISALPKPKGHMGLEEFFPTNWNEDEKQDTQVRVVPDDEAEELRSYEDDGENIPDFYIPESLENAIIDFILSGAARRYRGESNFHHSMLIHTKHTISNQSPIARKVETLVEYWNNHLLNEFSDKGVSLKDRFRKRWNDHFLTHPSTEETWDQIQPELMNFIHDGYNVMEINSSTEHNLDYDSHEMTGLKVIAIGGNRLSRGLTLEGLCSTFFIRESRMYDTLTQMGRWFGFRPGYEDLVRLHVTPTLVEWFTWLVGVERELRADIERYGETGMLPKHLAVRILRHRKMLPTSASKMRHAKAYAGGMSSSCPRMNKFPYDSTGLLTGNIASTSAFLQSLGPPTENQVDNSLLWKGADPDSIISFIQGFSTHESDNSFNKADIINHINNRIPLGELSNWSVALIHNTKGTVAAPFSNTGFDHEFGLTTRSRLVNSESIGELMQPMHFVIDLPGERETYRTDGKFSYSKMYKHREATNPLLVIYVLDKDSDISSQARQTRQPLFSADQTREHIVALGLAFPEANMTDEERESLVGYWAQGGMEHEPNNEPEVDG